MEDQLASQGASKGRGTQAGLGELAPFLSPLLVRSASEVDPQKASFLSGNDPGVRESQQTGQILRSLGNCQGTTEETSKRGVEEPRRILPLPIEENVPGEERSVQETLLMALCNQSSHGRQNLVSDLAFGPLVQPSLQRHRVFLESRDQITRESERAGIDLSESDWIQAGDTSVSKGDQDLVFPTGTTLEEPGSKLQEGS
jgi:hypothetical protein